MNRPLAVLAILAALGAAVYGGYRLGQQQGPTAPAAKESGDNVDAKTGRKVLYWHDPMVPGQKFDQPGKSPFMDMQLVPVYADEAGREGTVSISPQVAQNLGVRTAEAVKGSLEQRMRAVGSVAYNERELVVLQARVSGFVERLNVRAPLDSVRKGQALVELLVPEWVAAQEEYLALRASTVPGADALRAAALQRMRLSGMSGETIRAVEEGGKVQARSILQSPIDGVVAELSVREGMTVIAGAPLFRINGLESVWINVEIPEAQAASIRPGQSAEVRDAASGAALKGRVQALLPQVNPATRTLTARLEVPNPRGTLAPGMFVTAELGTPARAAAVLVPSEAVIQTGRRTVVIEALGEGKFKPLDVEMGQESGGQTEIRKGLEPGQRVVVSGQFLIDSESSLRSALTRMSGEDVRKGTSQAATHRGEGRVESVRKDEITISHGPIASMQWPSMTMGFKVPPAGPAPSVKEGDAIDFEFRQAPDGAFELTRVTPRLAAGGKK